MTDLIFIYNAKSGVANAFIDWGHKIISPETYDCNLCSITYNNFGKEKKWSDFLKKINIQSRFYYIDHLKDLTFVNDDTKLPCIFIKQDNKFKLIIDSKELNTFVSVDQLITRLEDFLV